MINNNKGYSLFSMDDCSFNGISRAVKPNTKPILAILEPIALPMAKFVLPCIAALMPTKISGAEVPKATIVKPMMSGDILKYFAQFAAPVTKWLADHNSPINPNSK